MKTFEAHRLLRNRHAMTIAAAFWPRRFDLPEPEMRLFRVAEDSQIQGACHWQTERNKANESRQDVREKQKQIPQPQAAPFEAQGKQERTLRVGMTGDGGNVTTAKTYEQTRHVGDPEKQKQVLPPEAARRAHPGGRDDSDVADAAGDVDRDLPVVVVVHGLEGSCESNYVRGIAEQAWLRGFHVVRLNQRNCGGTEHLTPTLYNSGMSDDYAAVLRELADDGFTQIFFAGYSMGGNLVLKMAGEMGNAHPRALRGVCAVCPALDLAACADALEKRENYLYQRRFVKGLMERYARKVALWPQVYSPNGQSSESALAARVRTVRQFDDVITAPCFGFRDAQEYYESASARRVVHQIAVPTLMITAQDDPFVPYESFLAALVTENPAIEFVATEHGGHCGFISRHGGAERFWAEARVAEFCAARS